MSIQILPFFALYILLSTGEERYIGNVTTCDEVETVIEDMKKQKLPEEEQQQVWGYACVNEEVHRLRQVGQGYVLEDVK